jgi:hypothetical protein
MVIAGAPQDDAGECCCTGKLQVRGADHELRVAKQWLEVLKARALRLCRAWSHELPQNVGTPASGVVAGHEPHRLMYAARVELSAGHVSVELRRRERKRLMYSGWCKKS